MRTVDSFLFRGMMTSRAVAEMRSNGVLRTPLLTQDDRRDIDLFVAVPADIRGGSIEMQRTYRMLYVFENLVREYIDKRFTEVDGTANWWDGRAGVDLKRKVSSRQQDIANNSWHEGRNSHPLFLIDFGDLAKLIANHWAVFKDFLPSQSWVSSRITETERSRNVIAHTNRLTADEIIRLEQHVRDWIRQVI